MVSGRNDDDTLPHRRGHLAATWISPEIATQVVDKTRVSLFSSAPLRSPCVLDALHLC